MEEIDSEDIIKIAEYLDNVEVPREGRKMWLDGVFYGEDV